MKKPVHFRKFVRNSRAGGVGGLVAHMEKPDSASWTAYYYHPDANGNIAAVTSPFRAIAAKFSYDAFGRTTSQSGPKSGIDIHAVTHRFSTKPMELELATSNTTLVPPPVSSGLYYYGYRFYSPNLGRWLSRDPIREQGGRNLYNFVGNDGVDSVDRLGLSALQRIDFFKSIRKIYGYFNLLSATKDCLDGLKKLPDLASDCKKSVEFLSNAGDLSRELSNMVNSNSGEAWDLYSNAVAESGHELGGPITVGIIAQGLGHEQFYEKYHSDMLAITNCYKCVKGCTELSKELAKIAALFL